MDYTERYKELRSLFSEDAVKIEIPGSKVRICNTRFYSEEPEEDFLNPDDAAFIENRTFSYPIFTPREASRSVILLLHGLNERNWIKYLAWAHYLSENTRSYVILFPISFHINRSPGSWKDPRLMAHEVKERTSSAESIRMTSFANVALSKRLTDDPRRFFFSGYRTVLDITRLLDSVRSGMHEIIPATSTFNVFSYSIGAFLAEILMMANPKNLFSSSRLFMFCGGSVFSRMQGTSRLIMDSLAFDRIFSYYLNEFEGTITHKNPLSDLFNSRLGLAFRSMIDTGRLRGFREKVMQELGERIFAITLMKDKIIPADAVISTLERFRKGKAVELIDFPYEYSHENPFPVSGEEFVSKKVDESFKRVMSEAVEFLI